MLSPSRLLAFSPSRLLAFSPSRLLAFSPSRLLALSIAVYLLTAFSTYAAQDHNDGRQNLPPIIVKASKQQQPLERINAAVTVVDEASLDAVQIRDTSDLQRVLPGVMTLYSSSFLYPNISVRGISSVQDFYNPALTVYVDGVPQLPSFAYQPLFDIEQIELLKGPQGTLYGKSAEGGVLNIVTRKPDSTPPFRLRSGASSRAGWEAQSSASGSLLQEMLYGTIALAARNAPGDISNPVNEQKHLGGWRSRSARTQLRLAPTEQPWEIGIFAARDCTAGHQDVYVAFDDIKPRRALMSPNMPIEYQPFQQNRCVNSYGANSNYDFGLWQLSTALGWQDFSMTRRYPLGDGRLSEPEDWKQNTQELRLATRADKRRR